MNNNPFSSRTGENPFSNRKARRFATSAQEEKSESQSQTQAQSKMQEEKSQSGNSSTASSPETKPETARDAGATTSAAVSAESSSSTAKKPQQDEIMESLFFDSEEEQLLAQRRAERKNEPVQKTAETLKREDKESPEAIIERKRREADDTYHGGLKSSRYLTFDMIQHIGEIDPYFFDSYLPEVLNATRVIRDMINERDDDSLAEARSNPTDDTLQEIAYRSVHSAMYEYLQTNHFGNLNKSVMSVMVINEILGFGPLDPLWRDRKIDEIICNGPWDIQVEIRGQMHRVQAVTFKDKTHLYGLLERLYGSIGKQVTRMNPNVDGRLHDQSRMSVVHDVAAPEGPNFTIRRHPANYWTPEKTIETGAASQEMMTDIGNMINKGASFLVIGGTSTGKTSILNSLSGFFDPNERILSIEDNLELMLNPNKLLGAAMETVPPQPDRPDSSGITMRDLVRASLRQRPDGIIIGEVRDDASYDLIQALNTGHWGASTTHANDADSGMKRIASLASQSGLITLDGALSQISTAFDFVIVLKHYAQDGSRKILSVNEIALHSQTGADGLPYLPTTPLWEFEPQNNEDPQDMTVRGEYVKKNELSDIRKRMKGFHISRNKTWEELRELSHIDEDALEKRRKERQKAGRG